jgi:hypothetical protein
MNLLFDEVDQGILNVTPETTVGSLKIYFNTHFPTHNSDNIQIIFNNNSRLSDLVWNTDEYDDVDFSEYSSILSGGTIKLNSSPISDKYINGLIYCHGNVFDKYDSFLPAIALIFKVDIDRIKLYTINKYETTEPDFLTDDDGRLPKNLYHKFDFVMDKNCPSVPSSLHGITRPEVHGFYEDFVRALKLNTDTWAIGIFQNFNKYQSKNIRNAYKKMASKYYRDKVLKEKLNESGRHKIALHIGNQMDLYYDSPKNSVNFTPRPKPSNRLTEEYINYRNGLITVRKVLKTAVKETSNIKLAFIGEKFVDEILKVDKDYFKYDLNETQINEILRYYYNNKDMINIKTDQFS